MRAADFRIAVVGGARIRVIAILQGFAPAKLGFGAGGVAVWRGVDQDAVRSRSATVRLEGVEQVEPAVQRCPAHRADTADFALPLQIAQRIDENQLCFGPAFTIADVVPRSENEVAY